jgi:hypothetical protein
MTRRANELITELRDRVRFLEAELTDRKEESRRKDHIIAALTQRIPQLEPASEPREHSENPTEHLDENSTTSINESRRLKRLYGYQDYCAGGLRGRNSEASERQEHARPKPSL